MITAVTSGIKVSVSSTFEEDLSNAASKHYIFSYRIGILNQNPFEVQLIRRHWYIKDSMAKVREVEGEGVVGEQPFLQNGEFFEYESACNLNSDFGMMEGYYLFRNVNNNQLFEVNIPAFVLEIPGKLN